MARRVLYDPVKALQGVVAGITNEEALDRFYFPIAGRTFAEISRVMIS